MPKTLVCISCRNKKYYKKEYFKGYYQNHSDKLSTESLKRYYENKKPPSLNPRGRPKKVLSIFKTFKKSLNLL